MSHLQLIGFPLFFIAALEILLAITLLRENRRNDPVNRSVAAFSFFSAAYALITGLMYANASWGYDVTFLARVNWISWMMIPAAGQFVFYIKDERSRAARLTGRILYPFWFLVFCISISTNLIEQGNYALLPFIDHSGPLGKPLRIVGLLQIAWVIYEIFRLKREVRGIKRAQLNFFLHGVVIYASCGAVLAGAFQLFGGFGLEPGLGSYFSLPWVVLTFYAITRYRLFDIRVIISRAITIGLLAGIFSVIQIGFLRLLETRIGPAWSILISAFFIGFVFFATGFAKILQHLVQRLVLQHRFDYQQILKETSSALTGILDLPELLGYFVTSIRDNLGVGNAVLFLEQKNGQYIEQPSAAAGNAESRWGQVLDAGIADWIGKHGQLVLREELGSAPADTEARIVSRYMSEGGFDLLMPLYFKGRLQGMLALGGRQNHEPYTLTDIDVLRMLTAQAAIAIENARLYDESRSVQESLRQSEERFRNLIETTSDWVWETDTEGRFTYVSPQIEDILGYEPAEVLGRRFFDFKPREESKRAMEFFSSQSAEKQPYMLYQNTYLHKTGRLVVIETSAVPIFDRGGNFSGYRGIDRDVSRRNELEGQLRYAQKMEAIGRLAGGVAHDFNNINATVVGYATMLRSKMKPDDSLRFEVTRILEATERATALTRSLLSFSRKQPVELRELDVSGMVSGMEKLLRGMLRDSIDLQFTVPENVLTVTADRIQLERVLMNLVTNARDALPKGGTISIETREIRINDEFVAAHGYGKPGTYALISVSDTGIGMEEATLKKIFEPFFTTKADGKGTGFGMSIVYDIVKQHKGYINVESAPGNGTACYVYLPLVPSAAQIGLGTSASI